MSKAAFDKIAAGLDEAALVAPYVAEIERLRAALKECEAELDAYYRAEYPTDHPYHKRKLENALAANPARVALEQNK